LVVRTTTKRYQTINKQTCYYFASHQRISNYSDNARAKNSFAGTARIHIIGIYQNRGPFAADTSTGSTGCPGRISPAQCDPFVRPTYPGKNI